jgi:hypothetical protein
MNKSTLILQINKEPIEFNINNKIKVLKIRTKFIFFLNGKEKIVRNFYLFFYYYKKKNNLLFCRKGDYVLVEGFMSKTNNSYMKEKIKIFASEVYLLF